MGKISNSGKDERNQYHGGVAGDQTGEEWMIKDWYNKNWIAVFRHPDPEVREMIASHAEKAAANDHIGYDQWQRTTFWTQLVASNYDPSQITVDCESDCSAGVAAIVKAVGFIKNIDALKNVPETMYTGNEKKYLKNAGFDVLTDPKYLKSDVNLIRGDILLYHKTKPESGHTAIYLSNPTEIQNGTKSIDEIANEVISGKWGNGEDRKNRLTSAGYSYEDVQRRVNELINSNKPSEVKPSKSYKVIAKSGLRVRSGPGTNHSILRVLSYGSTIAVKSINDGWAELEQGGFVASNYISEA